MRLMALRGTRPARSARSARSVRFVRSARFMLGAVWSAICFASSRPAAARLPPRLAAARAARALRRAIRRPGRPPPFELDATDGAVAARHRARILEPARRGDGRRVVGAAAAVAVGPVGLVGTAEEASGGVGEHRAQAVGAHVQVCPVAMAAHAQLLRGTGGLARHLVKRAERRISRRARRVQPQVVEARPARDARLADVRAHRPRHPFEKQSARRHQGRVDEVRAVGREEDVGVGPDAHLAAGGSGACACACCMQCTSAQTRTWRQMGSLPEGVP